MLQYNTYLEKRFVTSRDKLLNTLKKENNSVIKDTKKSCFKGFIYQTKKDNKDLLFALEEKVTSIIKDFEPEPAAKLIIELFWICKKELALYEKLIK